MTCGNTSYWYRLGGRLVPISCDEYVAALEKQLDSTADNRVTPEEIKRNLAISKRNPIS